MEKNDALHEAIFRLQRLNLGAVIPDMNSGELVLLKTISDCEKRNQESQRGVNVSEVVKVLCIPPPSVSRTMNALEEKGYIERTVNKSDRRNTLVALTESGNKKNQENRDAIDAFMARIFQRVGEDKVQMVVEHINKIYDATREELTLLKQSREGK